MNYFDPQTIERIRKGYYTAVYFNRTKEILSQEGDTTAVTMQLFQRNNGVVLCGLGEVAELLRNASGYWKGEKWVSGWSKLRVEALKDGDVIRAKEPVAHITGPYVYFAHLESLYLGILARRTLVATNSRRAVEAAAGKPIIFFADRFDYFLNQEGDGYAAHVGGVSGVCTQAHTSWWHGTPAGTIPHALIAVKNGDTVAAAKLFAKHFPTVPLIVLVDYDNDCPKTSAAVARALGKKLWGVRIDTSSDMIDASLKKTESEHGVTPALVGNVRQALNRAGYPEVKIVVSGGFTPEKIRSFEQQKTPVDVYGVGSALVKGGNDFTADVVLVEGRRQVKVGRFYQSNSRFHVLT